MSIIGGSGNPAKKGWEIGSCYLGEWPASRAGGRDAGWARAPPSACCTVHPRLLLHHQVPELLPVSPVHLGEGHLTRHPPTPDSDSESGSRRPLKPDPIWIHIQNTVKIHHIIVHPITLLRSWSSCIFWRCILTASCPAASEVCSPYAPLPRLEKNVIPS